MLVLLGDYFFSKKGWVYGFLANSFKELVLTFDMWFSKITKLIWPLIKVLMNQKTYLEPLIFYTRFFMKTINYWIFFPKPRVEGPMILEPKSNQKWRSLTKNLKSHNNYKKCNFWGLFLNIVNIMSLH